MIKDKKHLEDFDKNYIKNREFTYRQNLRIYEALWAEAVSLKILPPENPLEGIEADIELARILNLKK